MTAEKAANKPKGRGGPRPGAGKRPLIDGQRMQARMVTLDAQTLEAALSLGN